MLIALYTLIRNNADDITRWFEQTISNWTPVVAQLLTIGIVVLGILIMLCANMRDVNARLRATGHGIVGIIVAIGSTIVLSIFRLIRWLLGLTVAAISGTYVMSHAALRRRGVHPALSVLLAVLAALLVLALII